MSTQREVNDRLAALEEEERHLRRAGAGTDAYGADPLNEVAVASAAGRAARLKTIAQEREALSPSAEPVAPVGVRATVQLEHAYAVVGQNLNGLVTVFNDGDSEIVVTAVDPASQPSALIGRVDIPPRGHVVKPHSWRSWAISMLAHHPRIGPALHYVVGATVHLADDSQLESESADLAVHSPFGQ